MATTNRGGSRASRGSKSRSSGRNNNPEGHNQYSGMMSTARENPLATAAAVGGAVAAGVFLWSRRNQISDQIGNLADQISEWREGLESNSDFPLKARTQPAASWRIPGRTIPPTPRARRNSRKKL